MGHDLGGTGGARSSTAHSPACCKSLRSSSLVLRSSSLSACDADISALCCHQLLEGAHGLHELLHGLLSPSKNRSSLIKEYLTWKDKGHFDGRLHSDAQVSIRAKKHQVYKVVQS